MTGAMVTNRYDKKNVCGNVTCEIAPPLPVPKKRG